MLGQRPPDIWDDWNACEARERLAQGEAVPAFEPLAVKDIRSLAVVALFGGELPAIPLPMVTPVNVLAN